MWPETEEEGARRFLFFLNYATAVMATIAIDLAYNYGLWKKIFTLKVLKLMPRGALKI